MHFTDFDKRHFWLHYNDNGPMFYCRIVTIPEDALVYIEEDKFKADKFILGSKISMEDSNLFKNDFTPLLIQEKTNKTCTLPVLENRENPHKNTFGC